MADIVLVNPKFEASYWGLEHALPFFGKRANVPVACLPLLAALTPDDHEVTLVDENVEAIDFERLARADIVGITGMSVQRARMKTLLERLADQDVCVVVGGPWITVKEDDFDGLADVVFIGESEETWPQFLREWQEGSHHRRYEQAEPTDMTRVPTPRFDRLKMEHYLLGSVQFSRGCPFECEFCDIIVIFGRRPRLKTSRQVIQELEAIRVQRVAAVCVVDDNLIGNKKAIKSILRDVIKWQQAEGYPLTFFTEASIDLAEDDEMMRLMTEANFVTVFIGVESPNEASLRETKKFQNVRKGTLTDKIHTIQNAGLEVWCGMIVGFDHDDDSIFASQRRFIRESRIQHAMIGMLVAIPKTPLYKRLADEGRLDDSDKPSCGTNVIPLRLSREELRDGYVRLMQDLYEPEAYFDSLDGLYLDDDFQYALPRGRYWRRHPVNWLKAQTTSLIRFLYLYRRLTHDIPDSRLRQCYRTRLRRAVRRRPDPDMLLVYAIKCGMHYHHHTMATQMARRETDLVNSF